MSSVWVRLYYEGKDKPEGQPVKIKPTPEDVADLKVVAFPGRDATFYAVVKLYPPGTEPPFSQAKAMRPSMNVPRNTSDENPLIVVAPAPKQADDGRQCFLVGGTVINAKQSKGARGNVYKFLEKYYGQYSLTEGIQVGYTGNNLHFKAYFRSFEAACGFQNAMNQWEIHKELANLGGVTLDPLTPAPVTWQSDFTRIYLQDYKPQDHESPCQTLDQLHSYHLSVPVTEPVEPATNLLHFQCIDKTMPHIKHYKCHLKDKAKFRHLQMNENNMVAASWLFHQQLDGLNVEEGIPLVALSWTDASDGPLASHNGRYRVALLVEFFYQELAAAFAAPDLSRKVDGKKWQITVYVEDKDLFKECVDWKSDHTKEQWNAHRAFLSAA